jgi:hypothetical protein
MQRGIRPDRKVGPTRRSTPVPGYVGSGHRQSDRHRPWQQARRHALRTHLRSGCRVRRRRWQSANDGTAPARDPVLVPAGILARDGGELSLQRPCNRNCPAPTVLPCSGLPLTGKAYRDDALIETTVAFALAGGAADHLPMSDDPAGVTDLIITSTSRASTGPTPPHPRRTAESSQGHAIADVRDPRRRHRGQPRRRASSRMPHAELDASVDTGIG